MLEDLRAGDCAGWFVGCQGPLLYIASLFFPVFLGDDNSNKENVLHTANRDNRNDGGIVMEELTGCQI